MKDLLNRYNLVRYRSEQICSSLKTEDYVVQPVVDISPPKWHLGHSTWFFETFLLRPNVATYKEYDPMYNYVFNSYYETIGARVIRTDRGNLSRPSVEDIYKYRRYVDDAMRQWLSAPIPPALEALLILGLNHEQQHQELLATDIKYILGNNPLMPVYDELAIVVPANSCAADLIPVEGGVYEIGHTGDGFCFDNELGRHSVYLHGFKIAAGLVSSGEFLQFMEEDGYRRHEFWHAEGLDWVRKNSIEAPLYWHRVDGVWHEYRPSGLQRVALEQPVCHISFYEAAAYAAWRGMRLPTEFEWEAAARELNWGLRWEWTNSAYLPYPGFVRAKGAIGEYNGKFMVNQMVLRGASTVTPPGHSRISYRNFFHPHLRWQYTGLRLAE